MTIESGDAASIKRLKSEAFFISSPLTDGIQEVARGDPRLCGRCCGVDVGNENARRLR
jgi:hypothetical protein